MSPRLTASKEEVKGMEAFPEGLYTFRLDGFKPKFSKDRGSVNLNPVLKIINHSTLNDRILFENLNTKAQWIWPEFCHAFGVPLGEEKGEFVFPGDFPGDENNPESWNYIGPLLGQTGKIYVIQADNTKGGIKNAAKQYICKLPPGACSHKHNANLAR
jgi:hypothetical protein